jgi:uncharacterized protein YbcI
MSDLKRALEIESEIARSLLANIHSVLSDDEEMAITAIEGETNLLETISVAVERISELEALEDATKARLDALKARKERFGRQAENIRTALLAAMAAVEMRKLELPTATITLKAVPPKANVYSEADVPSSFWKPQPPKLDLAAITAALKAKETIPGASLSNGNETVSIRFK